MCNCLTDHIPVHTFEYSLLIAYTRTVCNCRLYMPGNKWVLRLCFLPRNGQRCTHVVRWNHCENKFSVVVLGKNAGANVSEQKAMNIWSLICVLYARWVKGSNSPLFCTSYQKAITIYHSRRNSSECNIISFDLTDFPWQWKRHWVPRRCLPYLSAI